MSALSKVGMSVLSLLVVRFGGCEVDATGWRPLADAGKRRLLMVWTAKRWPNYPDVPTCRMANHTPWDNQACSASLAKYDMVPNYKSTEDYKRFVTEVIESDRHPRTCQEDELKSVYRIQSRFVGTMRFPILTVSLLRAFFDRRINLAAKVSYPWERLRPREEA